MSNSNLNKSNINKQLLDFIDGSPTPYHAVSSTIKLLDSQGFTRLREVDDWSLKANGKYYVTRQDSTLLAFKVGREDLIRSGLRIMGTHIDSPCLKVKPNPVKTVQGYIQLGVETYGGVLLNPWFDRDLSLAGKAVCRTKEGQLSAKLIDFERAVAVIPSLAIHLDRTANDKRSINPQEDIKPILFQGKSGTDLNDLLKSQLKKQGSWQDGDEILESDLRFYDVQKGALVGLQGDFLCSARLDNLLSSFLSLKALIDSDDSFTSFLIMNDHEEVGSTSDAGAQSNLFDNVIERLVGKAEDRQRMIAQSMMFSIDNAHGIHPNYASRHDDNHGPLLNSGPVIKFDANQSYATSSHSAALVKMLAEQVSVPLQSYVVKTGMRCGSTIGPMSAAKIGVPTVDLGLATFGMHSIRETSGAYDSMYMYQLLCQFLACANLFGGIYSD